jgi:hypothetical protein
MTSPAHAHSAGTCLNPSALWDLMEQSYSGLRLGMSTGKGFVRTWTNVHLANALFRWTLPFVMSRTWLAALIIPLVAHD